MAKTNQHELREKFVKQRLHDINLKLDQGTTELTIQFQSCPTTLLPLQITLDRNLQEFVQLQQKYLSNRMKYQLKRYQESIREKELWQILLTYSLTNDQVECSNKMNFLE